MTIEKGRVEMGDEIFAAISVWGKPVAELKSVSFGCLDDVFFELRRRASRHVGLTKVSVRNRTRGWMIQVPLLLCATAGASV